MKTETEILEALLTLNKAKDLILAYGTPKPDTILELDCRISALQWVLNYKK